MPSAIVVGAGIFGASLAHRLAADGWQVTLVERDEPAGPRSTSGSHSRLIRSAHGADDWYAALARRARSCWREIERDSGTELLVECGLLWMARRDDGWEASSERVLRELGIPCERLSPREAARLFPSFDPAGLAWALLEPEAGALRAQLAVETLVTLARRNGAELVRAEARPVPGGVQAGDRVLEADHVVWACGPWLGSLFPGVADIRVERVEYATFACDPSWSAERGVPTWVDFDADVYGLPDIDGAGFKVAPEGEARPFDPDIIERPLTAEREAAARRYLATRFPGLAGAARSGGRVCQYEMTADSEFLIAPHPEHERVWLLGGGSGHGFKHGPALAEFVRDLLSGAAQPLERHAAGPRAQGPLLTLGLGAEAR
jgi:glycine/D-amino acid oxidase-like deaminating enzyme